MGIHDFAGAFAKSCCLHVALSHPKPVVVVLQQLPVETYFSPNSCTQTTRKYLGYEAGLRMGRLAHYYAILTAPKQTCSTASASESVAWTGFLEKKKVSF